MAQRPETRSDSERPPPGGNGGGTNGAPIPDAKSNGDAKANGEGKSEASPSSSLAATPWRSYKEQVAEIAQRIVEAQRPIRVLQALRWEPSVEEAFRRGRCHELPRVGPDDYAKVDLGFEPKAKIEEFDVIAHSIEGELGTKDPIGRILVATAIEYRDVARMLAARGTKEFYTCSKKLYGSPKDKFPDNKTSVRDLGLALYDTLT